MAFSISFMQTPLEHPYDDGTTTAARGLIVLGDFREEFLANLYEWTQKDYQEQWSRAIHRLINGELKAVLITSYVSPAVHSNLEWWALYREGEKVAVQNQLLFYESTQDEFDVRRAAEFLKERETLSEDGRPISEWNVSMNDLRTFYQIPDGSSYKDPL